MEFLGQTLETSDLPVIGLLVVLEGVLSFDNALVLGLLASRLPKEQRARALSYGLVGAFVFRLLSVGAASFLIQWRVVKLVGALYLLYVALNWLFFESKELHTDAKVSFDEKGHPVVTKGSGEELSEFEADEITAVRAPAERALSKVSSGFWWTVLVIELTDIAFAVDSILAAIALVGAPPPGHVGTHPKLWVVIAGGMMGVLLMRFAAAAFIRLLERFPRFETTAYLLVAIIGLKLGIDWYFNTAEHPHVIDFHDYRNPAFWAFWFSMLGCLAYGFVPKKAKG